MRQHFIVAALLAAAAILACGTDDRITITSEGTMMTTVGKSAATASTYDDRAAGDIVILAIVNVGVGTPPKVPDLYGDMRCRLKIQVPDNGKVEVELSFSDRNDCLRLF